MDLKDTRIELGLNIRQMAEAMGVHRSTWNKWERNEQQPPAVAIRLIAMLLWIKDKNMLDTYLARFNIKCADQRA